MMYCEIEALYLLFSILYCIFPPLTPHPRCPLLKAIMPLIDHRDEQGQGGR